MKYATLNKEQFDAMQFNAGLLVTAFDPAMPSVEDEDIVCATTGGFELNITSDMYDLGADVYMMPPGTMEMLIVTGWTVDCTFTSISTSERFIKLALGAADTDGGNIPRDDVQADDFKDLWWIGDRVDGGIVAVKIINALSDGGIEYTAEKNAIGGMDVHLLAHTSFDMDGAIPVEIYSIDGYPMMSIVRHMYLQADNMPDTDIARIDEQTGVLTIEHDSEWTYNLISETGVMEVSKS